MTPREAAQTRRVFEMLAKAVREQGANVERYKGYFLVSTKDGWMVLRGNGSRVS